MMRVLRIVAVAIAVGGAIDPVVTVTGRARGRIAIVVQEPRSSAADRVRAQLTADLDGAFDVVPDAVSDAAAAIVIGDRYPESSDAGSSLGPSDVGSGFSRTFTGPISTVTLVAPDVSLVGVGAPREVPVATAIHVDADIDGRDAVGQSTDIVARIAGLEVGRATHRWTRARERWRAALDVVPFGEPPFVVRLDAGSSSADVVVDRRTAPIRVLVHDARPSWASTFTRRALEADARFQVESLVSSSRGIAARTGGAAPLSDPRLDAFDAILAGGLDALTAGDVHALDRYMRERGGAVVVLPDQRVVRGPVVDLMPSSTERLLEGPAALTTTRAAATLQASELLLPAGLPPTSDVLAGMPGADASPVVVTMPHGAGRLLVSGAMDAWRFRAANDRAFDRFWQATVAGLALATPPPVDISVTPSPLRPGDRVDVLVRARSASAAARVSASVDDRPIRLWPDAELGVYRGEFVADPQPRRSVIRATVSGNVDVTTTRAVVVADVRRVSNSAAAPLAMLASAHGGIDVAPDHLADVVRFVHDHVQTVRTSRPARPMRSAWWIVPFAGCLAGEWWLRRRRGLR